MYVQIKLLCFVRVMYCDTDHTRIVTTSAHALQLTTATLLLVMTWHKTSEIHRESRKSGIKTPLATLILRDGTSVRGRVNSLLDNIISRYPIFPVSVLYIWRYPYITFTLDIATSVVLFIEVLAIVSHQVSGFILQCATEATLNLEPSRSDR